MSFALSFPIPLLPTAVACAVATVALWAPAGQAAQAASPQTLEVGQPQTQLQLDLGQSAQLEYRGVVKEVEIDRDRILSVRVPPGGDEVSLKARRVGKAQVKVTLASGKSYQTTVVVRRSQASLRKLLRQVRRIGGVEARLDLAARKIFVTGKAASHLERGRLESLKGTYPDAFQDQTKRSSGHNDSIVAAINELLVQYGITQMRAVNYGRFVTLRGVAGTAREKALALRIAQSVHPKIEDGVSQTSKGGAVIGADVLFLEVSQTNDTEAGLIGQPSANAQGSLGQAGFTGAAEELGKNLAYQVGPISSILKLIQQRSYKKILSNPKVITRSGSPANFKAGGTQFYPVTGKDGEPGLFPVSHGVELKLTPHIDEVDQIDLTIEAKVSEMVAGSNAIASTSESELATALTIQEGDSILLSGFKGTKKSKTVSRVPLLADIPIVGELFKGRRMQDESTEILVLLNLSRESPNSDKDSALFQELLEKGDDSVELSFFD